MCEYFYLHDLITGKKLSDASGMGFSLSVDRKSSTFSEVLVPPHTVLCDHTFPLLYKDRLKKKMKKLGKELRLHEYVERASLCTLLVHQEIFSREQRNLLSVASVIRLTCGDYRFLVSIITTALCFIVKSNEFKVYVVKKTQKKFTLKYISVCYIHFLQKSEPLHTRVGK